MSKGAKNRKLRSITVKGRPYKWHVSEPEEDYGAVSFRVFEGDSKQPLIREWIQIRKGALASITPAFVAAQIGYATEPLEFYRAAGGCICEKCGLTYRDHPYDGPFHDMYRWLHRLCNGDLVKL